jgi:ATP-binding cassette subfamily G (WHITE) protein 2 (SNQ2)
LDAIGAGSQKRIGNKDWGVRWLESEEFATVKAEVEEINQKAAASPDIQEEKSLSYATPFFTQLKVVVERANQAMWRSPDYVFTRLFAHVVIALLTGLTFLQVGNGYTDLQYRVFAIFIVTVLPAIVISQIEPMFIMARQVFIREASSKMYSPAVFAIAQLIAEIPGSILCAVAFFLSLYYPAGFNYSSDRAGYAFLVILVVEFFAVTIGQAVAALSPSIFIAAMANPFILIVTSLFCGVTIPPPQIPKFWREWLYHVDPLTYLISGLVSNELHGLEITCRESELFSFPPPAGQTCEQWAGPFVNATAGYLVDPAATDNCQYCPIKVGDEFYTPLGISYDHRYRDFGFLIVYVVFNAAVTVVGSIFLRYAKR